MYTAYFDNYMKIIKKFTDNEKVTGKRGYMDNGKFHLATMYNDPKTSGRKFYKFVMFNARIHGV